MSSLLLNCFNPLGTKATSGRYIGDILGARNARDRIYMGHKSYAWKIRPDIQHEAFNL